MCARSYGVDVHGAHDPVVADVEDRDRRGRELEVAEERAAARERERERARGSCRRARRRARCPSRGSRGETLRAPGRRGRAASRSSRRRGTSRPPEATPLNASTNAAFEIGDGPARRPASSSRSSGHASGSRSGATIRAVSTARGSPLVITRSKAMPASAAAVCLRLAPALVGERHLVRIDGRGRRRSTRPGRAA